MYRKTVLKNGLRVVTSFMPHTHSVCTAIFIGTGSAYEAENEAGISHFIEHLCFKGTKRRPTAREISAAIEGVGGIINAGTDRELTIFWCKTASPHFPLTLDVLTDLLLNSRFDSEDIQKERQVVIEEINMSLDSPQHRLGMLSDELLWPGQPLGRDVAGSKETVTNLTREQMLSYIARRYSPSKAVISIAGNIRHQRAVNLVTQVFADWIGNEVQSGYPTDDNQTAPKLHIEPRDTEQAHLCLAVHGLSLFHPDRFALDLLSTLLGEGMSSRLFTEIREHQGLAYSIHSYVEHFLNTGSFTIYAGVDPRKVRVAVTAILRELSQVKEEISENELTKAKQLSKGRLLLRMEDSRTVSGWLGAQELLCQRILTVEDVISIVDAISVDDLKRVAQQLLISQKLNLAIVGPIKTEESLIELLEL